MGRKKQSQDEVDRDQRIYELEQEEKDLYFFENDHQSPIRPEGYIQMRLLTMKEFYQGRLPSLTRAAHFFKALILICTATSTVFAYVSSDINKWVAILTSAASAITAWSEFKDGRRKAERYSNSIDGLRDLVSWWDSRSRLQQCSPVHINTLVTACETTIAGEYMAWRPSSNKAEDDAKNSDEATE